MECPLCKSQLRICKSEYKSDIGSTDVYVEQSFACVNRDCGNYAGNDLNNPKTIVKTVKNKVN